MEGPSKAEITCKDNKDGTCTVSYLPTAPGDYSIIGPMWASLADCPLTKGPTQAPSPCTLEPLDAGQPATTVTQLPPRGLLRAPFLGARKL